MSSMLTPEKCARIRKLCETYSGVDVCRIAKISSYTLWALKKRDFKPATRQKPMPADFSLMADRMSYDELSRHYRVGGPTLRRWFALIDRRYKSTRVYPKLPVPPREEVVEALDRLGLHGAAAHFGVGYTKFLQWRKELGLPIDQTHWPKAKRAAARRATSFGWIDRYAAERRAA